MRKSLPWLGPGFVYCVHEDASDALDQDLRRVGFEVVALPGEQMTEAGDFHAAARRAFGFPDYYGNNWDAFYECFGEVEFAHPTAVVWTGADRLAASDLKTFSEAIAQLTRFRDAFASTDESRPTQVELFLTGRGPAFRQPDDAVRPDWLTERPPR